MLLESQRMKILHVIPRLDFADGGPVRAVIDLSNATQKRGHQIAVASWAAPDAPQDWNAPGRPHTITVPEPDLPGGFLSKPQIRDLRPIVSRFDLIHLHGIWEPLVLQFARMAEHQDVPWVVSIRGMLDRWCMKQRALKKQVYLALGGSRTLNRAARIHLTAEAELEQARRYFRKSTPQVIPNLLNLEPYRELPPDSLAREQFAAFHSGDPVILFLSRIHYKKGIEHLVDAAAQLRDNGSSARVIIAGTGDEEYTKQIQDRVASHQLEDRVSLVGQVTGDLKLSLYRAADAFCLPTSQENFGFVFFEALAAGLPMVTTKGVDTWPELERSGAAEIVDLNSSDAPNTADLAAALGRLLDDPNLSQRGEQGRSWVFENLNPEHIAERFEQLYLGALSEQSPARHPNESPQA